MSNDNARRGPYSKGIAKRAEILDTALELIARNGYSGATLRELAAAVNLSPNGLLHYFGSKEDLFSEILRRRDEIDDTLLTSDGQDIAEYVTGFVAFIRHNTAVPGLVRLYSRLSNEASDPGHSSHEWFRDRYARLRAVHQANFERMQEAGRLDPELDPARLATLIIALGDGLQTQWMYNPDLDMATMTRSFLEAMLTPPPTGNG